MIGPKGENLVFLFCLPRSGSTLLSLLLSSHPLVHAPPEPWFLLRLAEVCGRAAPERVYDDHYAEIGTRAFLGEDTFLASARAFALCAYNRALETAGKPFFVDKTPRYYHLLGWIEDLFPEAKKVWLKRNPLDIAASYKRTMGISVDVLLGRRVQEASFDFPVGLPALEAYFGSPTENRYTLAYEALVADPEGQMRGLCRFLGVDLDPGMLDYGKDPVLMAAFAGSEVGDAKALTHARVHPGALGGWKTGLTREEALEIVHLLGTDLLETMGYGDALPPLDETAVPREVPLDLEVRKALLLDRYRKERRSAELEKYEKTLEDLRACERDRALRLLAIKDLGQRLDACEEDREARLAAIEDLGQRLDTCEGDRKARLEVILQMSESVREGQALVEELRHFDIRRIGGVAVLKALLKRVLRRPPALGPGPKGECPQ